MISYKYYNSYDIARRSSPEPAEERLFTGWAYNKFNNLHFKQTLETKRNT